jgi:SAM-dependent methyltransferase
LVDKLNVDDRVRLLDVGSGTGLFVLLVALVTGATVYGVEIRRDLHNVALKIGAALARECTRNAWLGVGKWRFFCDDARQALIDESVIRLNDDDKPLLISEFDDGSSTTIVTSASAASTSPVRLCLLSWCDVVFINNYALDDSLTSEVLREYGHRAPAGGRLVMLRNPHPRDRYNDVESPLALFETTRDDDVYDMPPGSIDWVTDERVQWVLMRVLPLGVRRQWFAQPAEKFRKMTPSLLK